MNRIAKIVRVRRDCSKVVSFLKYTAKHNTQRREFWGLWQRAMLI